MSDLTHREQQVVAGLAEGLTIEEIGKRHGIKPNTVRAHLRIASFKVGGKGKPLVRLVRWHYQQDSSKEAAG